MSAILENYRNKDIPGKEDCNTYHIPVQWSVYSTIRVEADNLQEALDKAREKIDDIPITPTECEYIDDSYIIAVESDEDAINAQNYYTVSDILITKDGEVIHD